MEIKAVALLLINFLVNSQSRDPQRVVIIVRFVKGPKIDKKLDSKCRENLIRAKFLSLLR